MKHFLAALILVAFTAPGVFAAASAGTQMTDGNLTKTSVIGWEPGKTITKTVTGTKPAFLNASTAGGTHQLRITCVNPVTGALMAGRVKANASGTEMPVYGVSDALVIPTTTTYLSFSKYSTGTATDSMKCTAVGN
jgi:hypothetical protein